MSDISISFKRQKPHAKIHYIGLTFQNVRQKDGHYSISAYSHGASTPQL
jgi:hypothetical protein